MLSLHSLTHSLTILYSFYLIAQLKASPSFTLLLPLPTGTLVNELTLSYCYNTFITDESLKPLRESYTVYESHARAGDEVAN